MTHDRNEDAAAAHDHRRPIDVQSGIVDAVSQPLSGQRAEDILCRGPTQHEPVDGFRIVGIEADLDRGHRCDRPGDTHEPCRRGAPRDHRMITVDVVQVQARDRDR